jgi:adenosylcobinamide kinase/adenosylcobinamide-phosphate guanylyltransferase
LTAGDELTHDGYLVRALPATHSPGALLYDIEDADGIRVLYATDTGPLSPSCLDAIEGRRYANVFLELTWGEATDHGTDHHDLVSFPATVAELRRRGAVTSGTGIYAIHLGHHNPPEPELGRRLAAFGAHAPRDGDVVLARVSGNEVNEGHTDAGRRTLVLGGARSGKSTEAERIVAADPDVVYVATAPLSLDDPEWAARIDEHRSRRPAQWRTVETLDVSEVLKTSAPGTTVLVDCLTLWLTGVIDAHRAWDDRSALAGVRSRIDDLTQALRASAARVVLVSNEVGSGVVPPTPSGRIFRDLLGVLNSRTAAECEQVLLVTAGRVQRL